MEVGEAPGRDEDINGVCFVGQAGQRLDSYNYKAAITEVVRLTNVARCCPFEVGSRKKIGKPSPKQIRHCAKQHLIPEIVRYRPQLIVPLGDKAWSFFGKGKISTVQGSFRSYTIKAEDYPLLLNEDLTTPLLPTFHPAYALRGNVMADRAILEDLTKARMFIEGVEAGERTNYVYYSDLDLIDQLADWIVAQHRGGNFKYPCIACDLECEGLDWRDPEKNIVGVGFSWEKGTGVYIPFNGNTSPWKNNYGALMRVRGAIKRVLDAVPVVGQCFEFDRRWLWFHLGLQARLYFDTMSAHKWLYQDTRPHKLEYMTGAYTDLFMHKAEAQAAGAYDDNMTNTDPEIVARLCGGDCDATLRLMPILSDKINEERQSLAEFHLWNMEPADEMFGLDVAGAYMDMDANNELRKYFQKRMEATAESIRALKLNGVNINEWFMQTYKPDSKKPLSILLSSTKRNQHLLYTMLRLPAPKDKSTAETPLEVIVRKLDSEFPAPGEWNGVHPPQEEMDRYYVAKKVIAAILDYRGAQKQLGTYVEGFEKLKMPDGCVHPEYHICTTVTGRSSVSEPPLQGLPIKKEGGKFRRVFVSRFKNGLLYNGDESQIEVRTLAYYSQDPKMMELFMADEDMHRLVASRFYGKAPQDITKDERTVIKAVVFGMFYGRGNEALSQTTGLPIYVVEGIVKAFWEIFVAANQWREQTIWYAKQYGGVYGAQKRWRFLPHINNHRDRKLRSEAERQAVNTPIQGLASDFAQHGIVRTMRRMRREKFASIPFQFVHDSFGVDVYPGDLADLVCVCDDEFVTRAHKLFPWWNLPFKFEHEIGLNLRDMVEISYQDGMIVSEPKDTPDALNDIASVVSSWYNSDHVLVDADSEGKHRLSFTLGPRREVDKGEQWLSWSDDEFKTPALQPYYTQWGQVQGINQIEEVTS